MMTRKRFLLLALGSSTVFFAALVGFLWLSTQEEKAAPGEGSNGSDVPSLADMTPEQLEAAGRRRVEAMASGTSTFVALREKYGDEGIARIMMGISAIGDEDLSESGQPVIVIEIDTLKASGRTKR